MIPAALAAGEVRGALPRPGAQGMQMKPSSRLHASHGHQLDSPDIKHFDCLHLLKNLEMSEYALGIEYQI